MPCWALGKMNRVVVGGATSTLLPAYKVTGPWRALQRDSVHGLWGTILAQAQNSTIAFTRQSLPPQKTLIKAPIYKWTRTKRITDQVSPLKTDLDRKLTKGQQQPSPRGCFLLPEQLLRWVPALIMGYKGSGWAPGWFSCQGPCLLPALYPASLGHPRGWLFHAAENDCLPCHSGSLSPTYFPGIATGLIHNFVFFWWSPACLPAWFLTHRCSDFCHFFLP